jgi:signal transduction histidine kinase
MNDDVFTNNAGHELRNPLHGVCAGVKALQDGVLSPAEAAEELAAIAEGLALMVSVTNDMTDLSKLRAGQFVMHLAPTSLRQILDACITSVQPSVQHVSDIQLEFDVSTMPETVCPSCQLKVNAVWPFRANGRYRARAGADRRRPSASNYHQRPNQRDQVRGAIGARPDPCIVRGNVSTRLACGCAALAGWRQPDERGCCRRVQRLARAHDRGARLGTGFAGAV